MKNKKIMWKIIKAEKFSVSPYNMKEILCNKICYDSYTH